MDWIEAQLKSFGCTNTERIKYVYNAPAPRQGGRGAGGGRGTAPAADSRKRPGQGGSTIFGTTARTAFAPLLVVDGPDVQTERSIRFILKAANEKYATDYPAAVGPHMTNTDSGSFQNVVAAISLRENERGAQVGGGWDPHWHQPTDVYATFSGKDFRLGLNAAQTTLGAVAQLTGATLKK